MNRILVVDDESSIRKALSMGLASEDIQVDVAADGSAGIRLGTEKSYDILIVDLCLPDMDGFDVIKQVKPTSPEIVPIMITGHGGMESSIQAIRLEVSDYLEKPLSLESVKNSITRALEKRDLKRRAMRERLQQMLKAYMEERSDTIPMLVHQINNPLMCINGSAELAMLDLDDKEAMEEHITNIIEATQKISSINEELMKFGQLTEGKTEELDIRAILEESLVMFKDLLCLKGIFVETDIEGLDLKVPGNQFQFEQVFKNLILNAIDSMDGRPRKLLKITAALDVNASRVSIHILDTGCGIPAESLDRIFTPYFTGKQHGTGLGLPIVKSIVEKHSGEIQVQSQVGEGTAFRVTLLVTNN